MTHSNSTAEPAIQYDQTAVDLSVI